MAVYYKPQSPIQSGEDFIYPITTADQIMKSDNSRRLEQAGLIIADNSTSLGGVAAGEYALKTDTAPDSSKLGGKAPEYYLQPRNLLDNSDFTNPVNQRGVSSVTTTGYTIDRWYLEHAGDGISISDDGVTINATNSLIVFLQKINKEIRKVLIGKTITVTATDSSGNVGISTCVVPNFGEGVDSVQNTIGDTNLVVNIYTQSTDDTLSIRLFSGLIRSPVTIVNIALYEGSYTADTLPPYVPKGYGAELAECLRYYRALGTVRVAGNIIHSDGRVFAYIPCYVPMRKNPSIVTPSRVVVISNVGNKYSTDYDVYYGTSDESINGISLVTTFGSGVWTSNENCTVLIENMALNADL